jgi:hypothetical protein
MDKRASKTAYFLNRVLGYLALIGRNVRLPDSGGVWILVADAVRAPWEVADLLAASYPGIEAQRLPFVALLTDFDVEEFEREMQASGRSAEAATPVPVELEPAEVDEGELQPVALAEGEVEPVGLGEGDVDPDDGTPPLPEPARS